MNEIKTQFSSYLGYSFALLFIGGCIVGLGPLLAKVINAPIISIVFYRIMLPVPILFLLKRLNDTKFNNPPKTVRLNDLLIQLLIGLFFSLDLITFYISLRFTSIASATLISNLSPIFLVIFSLLVKRKITKSFLWPLIAIAGLAFLCDFKNSSSGTELIGNLIALISALFFTGYIILINKLGSSFGSIDIMLWSSIGGSIFLFFLCIIMQVDLHISSFHDFLMLLCMSLGTQLVGQTILTKAIANCPPSFSSLGILIDPIAAAAFAWILLGESLTLTKIIGALLILLSIFCAYTFSEDKHAKKI